MNDTPTTRNSYSRHISIQLIASISLFVICCNSKSEKLFTDQDNSWLENDTSQMKYATSKKEHKTSALTYDTSAFAIIELDSSKQVLGDQAMAPLAINQRDLALVDSLIPVFVEGYNINLTADRERYRINFPENNYRIQLVGFINIDKEKEVWVNAFCRGHREHWKTRPVIVFGGGSCYFSFHVNLTKKRIHSSYVNGAL